ncbi:MAG: SpoIID/LytB domain-containing protein, partial [bacterium]
MNQDRVRARIYRRSFSMGLLALTLLAGLFFVPAAGAASDDFVITGRGWGHGVGMSQWGAWQAAKEGVAFDEILAFYYPGTILGPIADSNKELRVRISSRPWTSNTANFVQVDLKPAVTAATLVKRTASGDAFEQISVGSLINVLYSGGKVRVVTSTGTQGPFDYVELRPGGGGDEQSAGRVAVQLKTSGATYDYREYWGTMRVQPGDDAGDLWVYNYVPLEKYVRSIAEVEYDWAMPGAGAYAPEAVKAQAVAARTYAVAKNGPLADNQYDQCYRGYSFEAQYPGIAQAAEDTAGLILTYQGAPITANFSGHSGGYTSIWSSSSPPYLPAQPDPWSLKAPPTGLDSAGPGYNWTYTISAGGLSDKVNGGMTNTSGKTFDVGLLTRVEIIARETADPESHAKTLRLTGSKGSASVSASAFKSLLGLRSTLLLAVSGGEPLAPGEFYDVGLDHIYHDQIARVVTAGLLSGYDTGLYKPYNSVSRWQFAKIAVNLHNIMHPDDQIPVVNVTTAPFEDVPVKKEETGDVSDWVAAAKKAGLVTGVTSTSFQPYVEVRRDQMATMMCRALGWEDEAAALPADTPSFADMSPADSHWGAATYLKQLDIIQGYTGPSGSGGTVLRPEEPIKRQHVAV